MQGAAVLVLNADLDPLHRVSLRHAIRMLFRGVAEVHESEPEIRIGPYERPLSVRLIHFIVTKWRYTAGPTWSRQGVLRRDSRKCGYCGAAAGDTVDHIRPVSRNGKNTWVNTVACCDPCNQKKGDRLPNEAGMTLKVKTYAPTWATLQR
jgi:5-methylcytosine-specific restriction endonuclease McrA